MKVRIIIRHIDEKVKWIGSKVYGHSEHHELIEVQTERVPLVDEEIRLPHLTCKVIDVSSKCIDGVLIPELLTYPNIRI